MSVSAKAIVLSAMPEGELQETQRKFCKQTGLLYYHVRRSDLGKAQRGFPDTVIVAGAVVWFIENKREGETLKPAQRPWRDALERAAGVKYRLVRPSTWEATRDEILRDMEAA